MNNIILIHEMYVSVITRNGVDSVTRRLHAKAGETVLVHGASGGVCVYIIKFLVAVIQSIHCCCVWGGRSKERRCIVQLHCT